MDNKGRGKDNLTDLFREKMQEAENPSLSSSLWDKIEGDLDSVQAKGVNDLFSEGFQGAESAVPEGVWSRINSELDKLQASEGKKGILFPFQSFQKWGVAASLVLIAFLGGKYFLPEGKQLATHDLEVLQGISTVPEIIENENSGLLADGKAEASSKEIRLIEKGNQKGFLYSKRSSEQAYSEIQLPIEKLDEGSQTNLLNGSRGIEPVPNIIPTRLEAFVELLREEFLYRPIPIYMTSNQSTLDLRSWIASADFATSSGELSARKAEFVSNVMNFSSRDGKGNSNLNIETDSETKDLKILTSEVDKSDTYGVRIGWNDNRLYYFSGLNYYRLHIVEQLEGGVQFESLEKLSEDKGSQLLADEVINLDQKIAFLSLPLKIGYKLWDKKLQIMPHTGFNFHFAVSENTQVEYENSDREVESHSFEIDRGFSYSTFDLGVDLSYPIVKNIALSLGTNYEKSFKALSRDKELASKYPDGFSLHAGIQINL